jgi:hypothetical protein
MFLKIILFHLIDCFCIVFFFRIWDQTEYELVNELTFEHNDSIQALIVVPEKREVRDNGQNFLFYFVPQKTPQMCPHFEIFFFFHLKGKDIPIVWSGSLDKQICLWADIEKIFWFGGSAREALLKSTNSI